MPSSIPKGAALLLRIALIPKAQRLPLAEKAACFARQKGFTLLIGGDPHLARRIRAHGAHYREADLAAQGRRARAAPPHWLITAACHSPQALRRAKEAGAHAALLSPVFPTPSHPGVPALGVVRFARMTKDAPLPVYALGGVGMEGFQRLSQTGAIGWAAKRLPKEKS